MQSLREKIDAIDNQLTELLIQRTELAKQVGELKTKDDKPIYYIPEREAEILNKTPNVITPIFKTILSTCRGLQSKIRIAYLATDEPLVLQHFGETIIQQPKKTRNAILHSIQANQTDYGVISLKELTNDLMTLNYFLQHDFLFCAETVNSDIKIAGKQKTRKTGSDKTLLFMQEPNTIIEINGHIDDEKIKSSSFLKHLGSYPKWR